MLITMAISLYTARVVIRVLGIDDYGIYNIVGGIVVLFSFMNTALRGATQRFLSFELGRDNTAGVNKVFSMSLQCHALYAIVLVILALSIGLWFVQTKLNIPDDRKDVAVLVYIISIATFVVNVFQAPFYAAIIANEKMSFYAYFSIFEVVSKLIVVFTLNLVGGDKLVTYGILLLLVSIISIIIVGAYCFKILCLNRPRFIKDSSLFKQMFGYAGWSMYNGFSFIGAQQGGNILVNIYSGVAANGAFGIANQVSNIIYSFVTNFQSAIEPQIVKSYSSSQYKEMYSLMNRAAYFSYYIFLLIAVPLLIEIEFVLTLWLGECPEYAVNFCRILLLYYLVDAIEAPLWMLIGATGEMKVYSLWSGTLAFMCVPIAWALLYFGYSVYWVFLARLIVNFISAVIRPVYVKHLVPSFSLTTYLKDVISKVLKVTFVIGGGIYLEIHFINTFHPLFLMGLSVLYTLIIVWAIGLTKSDRAALLSFVKNKINR